MIKGIFLIIFDEKNIKVYTFSDLIMLFSKAIFPIINYNKIIYSLNQICEILKEQFDNISDEVINLPPKNIGDNYLENMLDKNINMPQTSEIKVQKKSSEKSVKELFNLFINETPKSKNTKTIYQRAIKNILLDCFEKPLNECDISKCVKTFINSNHRVKDTTKDLYKKILEVFITWLNQNSYTTYQIPKTKEFQITSQSDDHRQALNCETFCSQADAKKNINKFLRSLNKNIDEFKYKIWLIHLILGTRRNETIQVIHNYKKGENFVTINTKCVDNFKIPLTPVVMELLNYVSDKAKQFTVRTLEQYIYASIPKSFKRKICPHGTRALFRTVIDLIDGGKFSFDAKEAYICHFNRTQTQKSYARCNFYPQRFDLQKIWGKFIMSMPACKGIIDIKKL